MNKANEAIQLHPLDISIYLVDTWKIFVYNLNNKFNFLYENQLCNLSISTFPFYYKHAQSNF